VPAAKAGTVAHRVERRRLFAVLFANFIVFGAGAIVIGATVPKILREFAWDYVVMGMVLGTGSVGYFVSTFLCGVAVRGWGPRRVIVGGLVVQATGLLLFGGMPGVAFNLVAVALIGMGEGGTEVVTNYCMVRLEPSGQSRLMNLMHAAFPLGAIAASLLMGLLLDNEVAWQAMFRALAVLCLGLALVLSRQPFTGMASPADSRSSRAAVASLLRRPLLVLLALIVLLYVGAEVGLSNWIAEYYVRALGATLATGAAMVSVIWLGLLIGRLLLSALYTGRSQEHLLLLLTGLTTLCLAGALSMDSPWWAGVLFWATGLGLSAIYPIVIVLVGVHFPAEQGLAIGLVSTAGGIGSFGFPFAMSALANAYGLLVGFMFYAGLCVLMTLVAAVVIWQPRWRGREHVTPQSDQG
jgi:fucose permease